MIDTFKGRSVDVRDAIGGERSVEWSVERRERPRAAARAGARGAFREAFGVAFVEPHERGSETLDREGFEVPEPPVGVYFGETYPVELVRADVQATAARVDPAPEERQRLAERRQRLGVHRRGVHPEQPLERREHSVAAVRGAVRVIDDRERFGAHSRKRSLVTGRECGVESGFGCRRGI